MMSKKQSVPGQQAYIKKSQKTPARELELAYKRLADVQGKGGR